MWCTSVAGVMRCLSKQSIHNGCSRKYLARNCSHRQSYPRCLALPLRSLANVWCSSQNPFAFDVVFGHRKARHGRSILCGILSHLLKWPAVFTMAFRKRIYFIPIYSSVKLFTLCYYSFTLIAQIVMFIICRHLLHPLFIHSLNGQTITPSCFCPHTQP